MRAEPKQPDDNGWYHFDNMGEFNEWVETLPEYDPTRPECGPTKRKVGVRWVCVCSGGCASGRCHTFVSGHQGHHISVKCDCI
jgi:hypothetical protein